MKQIKNGCFPKCHFIPHFDSNNDEKNVSLEHLHGINLENKSPISVKYSPNLVIRNTECNDSGVVLISSSDTEEHLMFKYGNDNNKFCESDKAHTSRKFVAYESVTTENFSSAYNNNNIYSSYKLSSEKLSDSKSTKSINDVEDIHEGSEFINVTPENSKISLDFEDILQKRRRTRSLTKHWSKMGISLDGSFNQLERNLKNTNTLDKTCLISSTSSEENIDVSNRTYVIDSTSSEENTDVSNRTYVIHSTSSEKSHNYTTLKSRDTGEKERHFTPTFKEQENFHESSVKCVENNLSNIEEKLILNKTLTLLQNESRSTAINTHHSDPSEKKLFYKTHFGSKMTLKTKQSRNKSNTISSLNDRTVTFKDQYDKNKASYIQNTFNSTSEKNLNENSIYSKIYAQSMSKDPIFPSNVTKHKLVSSNSSLDDPISQYKKVTEHNKTKPKKSQRRQFQTNSAPVYRKRICRPTTPVKFNSEHNRQSLKDKADEKRKEREIRVQKIKETRERLQREKEEKRRLTEERLKQKFEQHEKILKQKVNKFKMKLRNQKQWNSRPNASSTSTSSKDSKEDRANDNDACRNFQDSSQQLSKSGNSYHDIPFKKIALDSLEGDAGRNPGVSKKYSFVISCEETPVGFPTYIGVTESKKVNIIPECKLSVHNKYDEESNYVRLKASPNIENSYSNINHTLSQSDENDIIKSDKKQSEESNNKLNEKNSETKLLESNENTKLLSDKITSKEGCEKTSNFFCSAQKNSPKIVSISSTIKQDKNGEEHPQESCEIASLSSESGNCACSFSCFSAPKTKKNLKIESNSKTFAKNGIVNNIGNKRLCLTDPPKIATTLKKSVKKKEKVTAYKISDMHENSFEESKIDISKIPLWATGLYLKQALIHQYYDSPNVEQVFGTVPDEPVDLVAIFQIDKPEYHRRTSSEKWNATKTP